MSELHEHERVDIVAGELVEGALIGCLLRKPDDLVHCEAITVDNFLSFHAGLAYKTILDMWRAGEAINELTVIMRCRDLTTWLISLRDTGLHVHVPRYVSGITEMARRRRLRDEMTKGIARVMENDSGATLGLFSSLYERELTGKRSGTIKEGLERLEKKALECQNHGGRLGWQTGHSGLEDIPMQPGHVWVIGALTSTGKTAFMSTVACAQLWTHPNPRTMIFSTEMTAEQVVARLLAVKTGINAMVHLSGGYVEPHRTRAGMCKEQLKNKPVKIFDDLYDWPEIEGAVRAESLRRGVDVVWIDYVQNCRVPGAKSEYDAQMTLAKGLQRLAKRCRCTIVCLSQLPNSMINADHGQAQFKGAGEWAAVADVAIKLTRQDERGLLVDVRKNRHGRLTNFRLEYLDGWTRLG